MPSLADATRTGGDRQWRRLVAGVGLLVAGGLFIGLGAAGVLHGASTKTGVVVGGGAVVLSLIALSLRIPLGGRARAAAAAGAAVSMAGLLAVWALAPPAVLSRPLITGAGVFVYLAGLGVLLSSMLAEAALGPAFTGGRRRAGEVSWTRTERDRGARNQATDGGSSEDDLSFPLEDD